MKKVSIISPCYNGAGYLARFLDSLMQQDYADVEFIFVNDGSTDDTENVFSAYRPRLEAKGWKVVYIKQENAGQAAALSAGLKVFTGEYLMWPDSDDILYAGHIAKKVALMEENPAAGIGFCRLNKVNEENPDKPLCVLERRQNGTNDDKTNGWNRWHSLKISAGGSEQIIEGKNYPYMASFLKNLCLRPSCGRCRFNRLPRQGDLTVGDFWLVDNVDSRLNDDKGTSVILVNNEKGRRLLDAAAAKFKLLEKAPLEKAVDGNPNIVASSRHNPARDVFFHNRGRMSLAENLDFCAAGKFDAAILNFWPYSNFGAILTGYALQKALDEMGVSNRLIWYMNRANGNHLAETFLQSHFKKFADRYMKYTPLLEDEELERLNEQTSCFIAGSDQIWRSTAQGKDKGVYYLSFAGDRARKIACAASFGMADFIGTEEDETLAAFWLRRFDAVSVREDAGRKLCAEKMGIDAEVVIDPVFYIDRKYYDEMADSVSPELPQEYVLAYFLGRKLPENDQMAEYYARKLGLPLIYLSPKEMTTEEWLHYIRGARLLVTNSFHGVCFAVIFGREFVSVAARTMAFSRFETVLGRLGLENRLRPAAETAVSGNFDFTPINWKDVRRRIAAEKDKALSWLKQALSTSKTSLPPFEDRLLGKLCRRLALTQAAADKNGRDNGPNYRMLLAVIDYPRLRRRYWRYKILSKITFGKTRKKYKEKRKELKQKLKQVRRFRKDIGR